MPCDLPSPRASPCAWLAGLSLILAIGGLSFPLFVWEQSETARTEFYIRDTVTVTPSGSGQG